MNELASLAHLLEYRNSFDTDIGRLIGRPAERSHVGEHIASKLFHITLNKSATHKYCDGCFEKGFPLAGKSVDIKFYGKQDGLLAVNEAAQPDFFLVMTGASAQAVPSLGTSRPLAIESVYLFDGKEVAESLRRRRAKFGVAASIPRTAWLAAEIYPKTTNRKLAVTEDQYEMLGQFADPWRQAITDDAGVAAAENGTATKTLDAALEQILYNDDDGPVFDAWSASVGAFMQTPEYERGLLPDPQDPDPVQFLADARRFQADMGIESPAADSDQDEYPAKELASLAHLLQKRSTLDAGISLLIGRPAERSHIGEYIASKIFHIGLNKSASHKCFDGCFEKGSPLEGKTVDVKFYGKQESMLAVNETVQPDYFLVMTGARAEGGPSRSGSRALVIEFVYLFDGQAVGEGIRRRNGKFGVAAGIPQAEWRAAEVYPHPSNSAFVVTDEQRDQLGLFSTPWYLAKQPDANLLANGNRTPQREPVE
jgi:hypothetical protein